MKQGRSLGLSILPGPVREHGWPGRVARGGPSVTKFAKIKLAPGLRSGKCAGIFAENMS
jgi:hypothetical protein